MSDATDFGDVLERWYTPDISREDVIELSRRSNPKGLLRLGGFLALLAGFGAGAYFAIGTAFVIPAFFLYGTLYCFLNHVMHETHHRTPFKSLWINETVHWVSAFAHGAEPVFDRWAHTQHHTYTYFPDKDPEFVTGRPIRIGKVLAPLFGIGIIKPLPIIKRALGIIDDDVVEMVPRAHWKKMIWSSRFWILGYAAIIGSSLYFWTILPLVYTLFARFYGALIPSLLNNTQHIGLETNTYDHRLCTRNVRVHPVMSYIYWDMQYHIEHHMFPAVPFHALKKLHGKVKDRLPEPYPNMWAVYKEMLDTVRRQRTDPDYRVTPALPETQPRHRVQEAATNTPGAAGPSATSPEIRDGWVSVPGADRLVTGDVMPFVLDGMQYAVYRLEGGYYASAGKCTHAGALLAKGVIFGDEIECPAHQGRYRITDGEATRTPAHGCLRTYSVKEEDGKVWLKLPEENPQENPQD